MLLLLATLNVGMIFLLGVLVIFTFFKKFKVKPLEEAKKATEVLIEAGLHPTSRLRAAFPLEDGIMEEGGGPLLDVEGESTEIAEFEFVGTKYLGKASDFSDCPKKL